MRLFSWLHHKDKKVHKEDSKIIRTSKSLSSLPYIEPSQLVESANESVLSNMLSLDKRTFRNFPVMHKGEELCIYNDNIHQAKTTLNMDGFFVVMIYDGIPPQNQDVTSWNEDEIPVFFVYLNLDDKDIPHPEIKTPVQSKTGFLDFEATPPLTPVTPETPRSKQGYVNHLIDAGNPKSFTLGIGQLNEQLNYTTACYGIFCSPGGFIEQCYVSPRHFTAEESEAFYDEAKKRAKKAKGNEKPYSSPTPYVTSAADLDDFIKDFRRNALDLNRPAEDDKKPKSKHGKSKSKA
jgi:hypothetical protein